MWDVIRAHYLTLLRSEIDMKSRIFRSWMQVDYSPTYLSSVTRNCWRHESNLVWNFIRSKFCSCRHSLRIYCDNKNCLITKAQSAFVVSLFYFDKFNFPRLFSHKTFSCLNKRDLSAAIKIKDFEAWPRIAKTNTSMTNFKGDC